jgi:hypothetical protein
VQRVKSIYFETKETAPGNLSLDFLYLLLRDSGRKIRRWLSLPRASLEPSGFSPNASKRRHKKFIDKFSGAVSFVLDIHTRWV